MEVVAGVGEVRGCGGQKWGVGLQRAEGKSYDEGSEWGFVYSLTPTGHLQYGPGE